MVKEFVLLLRGGWTSPRFRNLREAGRLDILANCLTSAFFMSHSSRKDVVFHAILTGPPNPPLHLRFEGAMLHDIATDEASWEEIIRRVLSGKGHPGTTVEKSSLQTLIRSLAGRNIYVLEEGGERGMKLGKDPVFVIGDQVGLPKKDENYILRYGKKISLGKNAYLASQCITVLNYLMDVAK